MLDQEINEKLAKAVGFTFIDRRDYGVDIWMLPGEKYPGGNAVSHLPDFLNDMNACLKIIWPVLEKRGANAIQFRTDHGRIKCCLRFTGKWTPWEVAEFHASALCLVALKYFEEVGL